MNKNAGAAIASFGLRAATDVTGFGLGGHLLEMATASDCTVRLHTDAVPIMGRAAELAAVGLLPAGSHANRHYCDRTVLQLPDLDPVKVDLMFDAQTSGGMVLAVPQGLVEEVRAWLAAHGDLAAIVGDVERLRGDGRRLVLC